MASDDEIRRIASEALAGLSLEEIRALTQSLLGRGPSADLLSARTRPSRRRPRRKRPVTLRVRADLSATKPRVWRRLEVASDLMLDEVH